jgi:D-proline reductase (dithiol) PrdB
MNPASGILLFSVILCAISVGESFRTAASPQRHRGSQRFTENYHPELRFANLSFDICIMTISRKCVPFTPFDRELSKSTIAIVTAGGVHLRDQEPFNIADELGDLGYRIIPPDVDSSQLMVTHHHYDHTDADQDINIVFPVDVLRALEAEGFIGGIAKKHVGYMGYTMQLKAMYEGTAPEIANEIDKGSRADAVVLTGG